jgi:hypothetical protein
MYKYLLLLELFMSYIVKGIGGLSGPQPPCWRNQYQTSHVDKISNAAGLS